LIELLVVIAIIAMLAALTLGTLGYVNKKGAESRARAEVAALSAAIDSYKLEFGSYPASNNLYTELTGQGPTNTTRIFFEPTAGIATNNQFVDPWGIPYRYSTNPTNNVGFFDLWTEANEGTNEARWIRN
jgi:type II secretion system protein G